MTGDPAALQGQAGESVFYRNSQGDLMNEFFISGAGWNNQILTTGMAGDPATTVGDQTENVFYRDGHGNLINEFYPNGAWYNQVLVGVGVTTSLLPSGTVGTAYDATLAASGGNAPYRWSRAPGSGPLPPGLTLNSDGDISGTPDTSGTYDVTVAVQTGRTTTKPRTRFRAMEPLAITISA